MLNNVMPLKSKHFYYKTSVLESHNTMNPPKKATNAETVKSVNSAGQQK